MENIKDTAVTFYNSVAPAYNTQMDADVSNTEVRKRVHDYFAKNVNGPKVLDFGGGTGLDLPWLTKNGYEVEFCEPSTGMRNIAREMAKRELGNHCISFCTDYQTDFKNWTTETYDAKFDAVIANFAVLNSIRDINLLFRKISIILPPGGHIIASMLDTTCQGRIQYYFKNFFTAFADNKEPKLVTRYADVEHTAWLHTPSNIKKSAAGFFTLEHIERLKGFGFMLVHLRSPKKGSSQRG